MNFFDFLVTNRYPKSQNVIKINGAVNFDRNKSFNEVVNFGIQLNGKYEEINSE